MTDKVKYWIDLSDYDLETAVAMLNSKRYLYVGFMCHQTIEKAFKAYFTKINPDSVPFSHSLSYIAKKAGFYDMLDESQKDFIDIIEPLNIETRYPSHKEKLLRNLSFERCMELIQKTNDLQKWIKLKL